jgi:DNA helicase II / ATP-dependent DNA helicase PcrA
MINLSDTQKKIVQHDEGPLLVVAGPGSGKTRVLTERIRRLLTEKEGNFRILALTFTNKAANEMKERLNEFPDIEKRAFIGTLHSFCMEILANRGESVGIPKLPNIFESFQDRMQVLYNSVLENVELKKILLNKENQERQLSLWLEMIRDAKNNLILPEMMENDIDKKVYEAYNDGLQASDVVDFDDLLLLTYRLFQERPIIADFYRRQYQYLCIDEAQDLNEAQYQLIRSFCGTSFKNIMMVGDPNQAIFVWCGADPKYLKIFEKEFSAKKIVMNENFRSSKAVVKAAKALNSEYEIQGQLPIDGLIELLTGEDEKEEAELVINHLINLVNNGHKDVEGNLTWDRCALLGRNRYVLSTIEQKLDELKIPYYKQLTSQHESESTIIQNFELCLRLLANPRDCLHLGILQNRWNFPLDKISYKIDLDRKKFFTDIKNQLKDPDHRAVVEAIISMNWTENNFNLTNALDSLNNYIALNNKPEERALVMEDIKNWKKHWDFYLRSNPGGKHEIVSFLGQVALGTTQQPRQDGLALLTVHSAKGLEFDVVAIMGMAEGIFPDYRAKDDLLFEENRNAFVAVSRSKRLLFLSYAKRKIMPWGDVWSQKPSRYLKEIGLI